MKCRHTSSNKTQKRCRKRSFAIELMTIHKMAVSRGWKNPKRLENKLTQLVLTLPSLQCLHDEIYATLKCFLNAQLKEFINFFFILKILNLRIFMIDKSGVKKSLKFTKIHIFIEKLLNFKLLFNFFVF